MSALPTGTDVLIVGAGPAGLAVSLSLSQLGVDHVLIDRNDGIQPGTRAAAVQPATLEYLDRLGVASGLAAAGEHGHGFRFRDGERTLVRVSYDDLDTPYPYMLLISQQRTEEHLSRALAQRGGAIQRGCRLLGFSPDYPGVTATVSAPDGTVHAVRARYLVGCDGVHSHVRDTAGITFPGHAREQAYAVADIRLDGPLDPEDSDTTNYLSPQGMLLTSPLAGGLFRVVAEVPPGSGAPSAAEVQQLLDARGRGAHKVAEVVEASAYRSQERVAERFSDGPVFVVGDAAHTHSPAGGQGMNTGIQDAANLAWKLHAVLAGGAEESLLQTYDHERRPVAARTVAFTSQIADLTEVGDQATASLRNDAIAAATAAPGVTNWLANRLAELDIHYPARAAGPEDQSGRRVPPTVVAPAGLNWTLALPEPVAGPQYANLSVQVVRGLDATLLVRPDGYLAARDVPADATAVHVSLNEYALGA